LKDIGRPQTSDFRLSENNSREEKHRVLTGTETYGILMATRLKKGLCMVTRRDPVTKEDLNAFKEEIVHQFHIISEGLRSDVMQVAEGVVTVSEKLDRGHQELKKEFKRRGRRSCLR
jgi:hypothetical protein